MKIFCVQFEYEGNVCECFVKKIVHADNPCIYMVNLGDSFLIDKFNTKRLALFYDKANPALPDSNDTPLAAFHQHVLNAILSWEKSPIAEKRH